MKIGIYGRLFDDSFIPHIQELFDQLDIPDVSLTIFEPFHSYLTPRIKINKDCTLFNSHKEINGKIDCLFSIGGDGTLLDTIKLIRNTFIPVLGINTGRLGFLANISKEEIKSAVEDVIARKYSLENRSLLCLQSDVKLFGELNYALNELTIHKKDSSSMITIHTYIDNEYLNSYWADGLIVATPTGSTAYSLSCGGPILAPNSENFVITPIAPHNLNVRPIVVPDNVKIRLKVEGRGREYLVTLDSRSTTIDSAFELTVKKSSFEMSLIQLEGQNFFSTIRNKMLWGLDRRN